MGYAVMASYFMPIEHLSHYLKSYIDDLKFSSTSYNE